MHPWCIVNTGTCHSPQCTCVVHSPVIIKACEESLGRMILGRLFMACNLFLRNVCTLFSLWKSSCSQVALSNCLVYAEMGLKIYIIYQKGNNVLFILSSCPLEVLNDKMLFLGWRDSCHICLISYISVFLLHPRCHEIRGKTEACQGTEGGKGQIFW